MKRRSANIDAQIAEWQRRGLIVSVGPRVEIAGSPPVEISEKQFQAEVQAFARRHGWRCHHHTISKRSQPGWFDLVLVRGKRVIFAELKTSVGKLSEAQQEWFEAFKEAGQEVYIWRPSDWGDIVNRLQ